MAEESEKVSQSPTDSLTRPSALIAPGSPIKFSDISDIGRRITSDGGNNHQHKTGKGGIVSCSPIDIPECLTPTLEDHTLSEMLVTVANEDKGYVGCETFSQLPGDRSVSDGMVPTLVGQTPSPVVGCLSPFWLGSDVCRDGPGGSKIASQKTKKATMSLGLADKRLFVINNGRAAEDVAKPTGSIDETTNTCTRYYHQGTVMELVPGLTPVMKPDDYPDAGSAITEKLLPGNDKERAYLESGFCAMLVLFYEDPEKPRLEAMNKQELMDKLAALKKRSQTPSAEHFTPIVNISRDADVSDEYTTALYFTTKEYTYFVYVEETTLKLKKYKTGDTDPSADPRNNKQFFDKQESTNCTPCTARGAQGLSGGKEETDSSGRAAELDSEEKVKTQAGEVISGVDVADSANGSSNSASGNSSQLSSPESGSGIDPSTSKVLKNLVNRDSGVEASSTD